MLITCPSCASRYTVEDSRIGAEGRKVRCAACRESWFIAAEPASDQDIVFVPSPRPGSSRDLDAPPLALRIETLEPAVARLDVPPRPSSAASTRASWQRRPPTRRAPAAPSRALRRLVVGLSALVLLAAPATVPFRTAIVGAFPGTATIFARLGVPARREGVTVQELRASLVRDGRGAVLEITGTIANTASQPRPVPPLALAIAGGEEPLYDWSTTVAEGDLAPGASLPFTVRLASPPPAGTHVAVRFRDASSNRAVLRVRRM